MSIGFFFLQLQLVPLLVTSTRSGDVGLFVRLTWGGGSPRWHLTPSPHPVGCFSVSLGCSKRTLSGRGVAGWAEEREPSLWGSLRDVPLSLLLVPQDVVAKLSSSIRAAAGPPPCHRRVTVCPSCWTSFSGCRDREGRLGGTCPGAVVLDFLPVAGKGKVLEALGVGRQAGT